MYVGLSYELNMTTGDAGQLAAKLAEGGEAVAAGHADVEQDDVRAVAAGQAHGFLAVGGFGDDLDVARRRRAGS